MMSEKASVQEIVVERLIKKIQEEKILPWHKPFKEPCMNWYSKREYMGINKLLLSGGEYITPNQLKAYNEKHGTSFWFEKGTPWEIVVFYNRHDKKITPELAQQIMNNEKDYRKNRLVQIEGEFFLRYWFLRYYRVYNIKYIKDKEGNTLTPHIGNTVIEEFTPADQIVEKYIKATGVQIQESNKGAYYLESKDSVFLPRKEYFDCTEAYYRTLFHELIHSTGIKTRLNRECFYKYHAGSRERSKEELIAEVGSLLLASEAGFREETFWFDNSLEYVAGWCSWMRDNKAEVINGMLAAEKAKNYILSRGVKADYSTDRSIDNPDEVSEGGEIDSVFESEN